MDVSEAWKQAAAEVGGKYTPHGRGAGVDDQIVLQSGPWHIVMSKIYLTSGDSAIRVTALGATYVTTENLRFTIKRAGVFARIGKLLGMHDIAVGDAAFDEDFTIKGNDVSKVQELLADENLRALLSAQPRVFLTVRDDEGLFMRKFRKDVDELYFQVPEYIRDADRVVGLLHLFTATLNRMVAIGAAKAENTDNPFETPTAEELKSTVDNVAG
jgi:hypothetical protein